jgi:serine/threonine protein kinase
VEFLGRYEVIGEIASGGMGKVYLARVVGEGGFEREVAIKVMHRHLLEEPSFVSMFLDEARLAARIRHPNVVPTIDVQKTAEGLFLVMEFVEGLSLSAIFAQLRKTAGFDPRAKAPQSPAEAQAALARRLVPTEVGLRILRDALVGLHEAHELTDRDGKPLNLVHRDVTPANILVGKDGVARITDFGVARAEARLTTTKGGQIKGKLPYMPPEQLLSDKVDRRSDVYAVGVVMWEMLTGHGLFRAEHEGALLQKVLGGAPHSPRVENSSVPKPVDQLCMSALAIDVGDRPQTAADFADAIEEAAQKAGLKLPRARSVGAFVRKFKLNTAAMPARRQAPGSSPGTWPGADEGAAAPWWAASTEGSQPSQVSQAASPPSVRGSSPSSVGSSPGSSPSSSAAPSNGTDTAPSTSQLGAISRTLDTGVGTPTTQTSLGVAVHHGPRWIPAVAALSAVVAIGAAVATFVSRGSGTAQGAAPGSAVASERGSERAEPSASGPSAATTTGAADAGAPAAAESAAPAAAESGATTATPRHGPGPRPTAGPKPSSTGRPRSTGSLPSDYFPVEP